MNFTKIIAEKYFLKKKNNHIEGPKKNSSRSSFEYSYP